MEFYAPRGNQNKILLQLLLMNLYSYIPLGDGLESMEEFKEKVNYEQRHICKVDIVQLATAILENNDLLNATLAGTS